MDGLTDAYMRHILTSIGQYDWCVTEFIRVTDTVLPDHVFYQYCPELMQASCTDAGTPVHIQLLGSDAELLAANAVKAVNLGALAIDLNFGCPAKTVNRHRGGAVLLDEPHTLYRILQTVRKALPPSIPLSAKMRLGYMDDRYTLDNARAIQDAGAAWLTIHARTKSDAYHPPAYWHKIAPLHRDITIPIIANGEIWTRQDALACLEQSGCSDLMLGRGAVSRPDLVHCVRDSHYEPLSWTNLLNLQLKFLNLTMKSEYASCSFGSHSQSVQQGGFYDAGGENLDICWHSS